MRILILHLDYFGDLWREAGHETIPCGNKQTDEFRFPGEFVTIDSILSALGPSRVPDIIFWGDDSRSARVIGLERCRIPKVMWSVDTHHHEDWHTLYAQAFDLVVVAQSDYLPAFHQAGVPAEWLPLHATPEAVVPAPNGKLHDVCFVGTLDRLRNPDRVRFINELETRVPLHVASGPYVETFRRSRIVLNQTVKGDLNFRVFQALACGSLLLTERTTNGLLDLFKEDVHLVTYQPRDAQSAVAQIERYLADADARERIAASGWREVRRRHLRSHRAESLLQILDDLVTGKRPRHAPDPYTLDISMSLMYLHLCHRMQAWAFLIGEKPQPSLQVAAEQRLRRALAAQHLDIARRYLDIAAKRSPEDPLWREVARLMKAQFDRMPEQPLREAGKTEGSRESSAPRGESQGHQPVAGVLDIPAR